MKYIHYKEKGFTLIEMVVALGLFAVVAVVAIGALMRIMSSNRKAQSMQAAVNNVSFVLEAMSREIRVGAKITCSPDSSFNIPPLNGATCPISANSRTIAFESNEIVDNGGTPCNLKYAYKFVGGILYKAQESYCGEGNSTPFYPVLDDSSLVIQEFTFGLAKIGGPYPIVHIRIKGYSGVLEKEKTYFEVQTAVSQRLVQ